MRKSASQLTNIKSIHDNLNLNLLNTNYINLNNLISHKKIKNNDKNEKKPNVN